MCTLLIFCHFCLWKHCLGLLLSLSEKYHVADGENQNQKWYQPFRAQHYFQESGLDLNNFRLFSDYIRWIFALLCLGFVFTFFAGFSFDFGLSYLFLLQIFFCCRNHPLFLNNWFLLDFLFYFFLLFSLFFLFLLLKSTFFLLFFLLTSDKIFLFVFLLQIFFFGWKSWESFIFRVLPFLFLSLLIHSPPSLEDTLVGDGWSLETILLFRPWIFDIPYKTI